MPVLQGEPGQLPIVVQPLELRDPAALGLVGTGRLPSRCTCVRAGLRLEIGARSSAGNRDTGRWLPLLTCLQPLTWSPSSADRAGAAGAGESCARGRAGTQVRARGRQSGFSPPASSQKPLGPAQPSTEPPAAPLDTDRARRTPGFRGPLRPKLWVETEAFCLPAVGKGAEVRVSEGLTKELGDAAGEKGPPHPPLETRVLGGGAGLGGPTLKQHRDQSTTRFWVVPGANILSRI